ncbi:MAG: EamA family transporter [Clostridia bacterium]|nr:EamA family transporter [Clostridia bacterium]
MYYLLLILATLLYALAFYFNKRVEENCHSNSDTTVLFLLITWVEIFLVLFVLLGGKLQFTYFSLLCAAVHALSMVTYTVLNLKILKTVELSKYSLYNMLGGMLVPTAYGILFANEPITWGKALCIILVTLSLIYDTGKSSNNKKEIIFLFSVFFINGLFGVISAFHQNSAHAHVGSLEYMSIQAILISVCSLIWLLAKKTKSGKINAVKNKKAYPNMLGYGIIYGGAELILLVAIVHIPSSIQFPIITGGTIVFSTIISFLIGETRNKKSLISLLMAIIGLGFLFV